MGCPVSLFAAGEGPEKAQGTVPVLGGVSRLANPLACVPVHTIACRGA